jgi:hypothetical protein
MPAGWRKICAMPSETTKPTISPPRPLSRNATKREIKAWVMELAGYLEDSGSTVSGVSPDNLACSLSIARELYRVCPELVQLDHPKLDAILDDDLEFGLRRPTPEEIAFWKSEQLSTVIQ